MSPMKRVPLAVLFLIAVALLAAGAAPAMGAGCKLTCVVDVNDPDYGASGEASLTKLKFLYELWGGYRYYEGDLRVTCHGLTPGATYDVSSGGQFTVDASGNGTNKDPIVVCKGPRGWYMVQVFVSRVDDFYPVVLRGSFYPSGH